MKIHILAAAAVAVLAFAPLAHADDLDSTTFIEQDSNTAVDDNDTTGSVIVKRQQPTVVIERQQPTVIIKKTRPAVIIDQDEDGDLN